TGCGQVRLGGSGEVALPFEPRTDQALDCCIEVRARTTLNTAERGEPLIPLRIVVVGLSQQHCGLRGSGRSLVSVDDLAEVCLGELNVAAREGRLSRIESLLSAAIGGFGGLPVGVEATSGDCDDNSTDCETLSVQQEPLGECFGRFIAGAARGSG